MHYYPGCTLKATATQFESSAIASANALDVEMVELRRWNCCGTVSSLTSDDLIHHLAPIRNLIRVQNENGNTVTTLCSMCFNTLKRANLLLKQDPEKKEKINAFMYEEDDYRGEVEVLHLLEVFRDKIGFERIGEKVTTPLKGLRVSPYYGCLLLRPEEVGIDRAESPTVLEELLQCVEAEPTDNPYKTECCGSYQTVDKPDVVMEKARDIISSAARNRGECLVVSCPLCFFNLDRRQRDLAERYQDAVLLPVFYFTQLLALALGLGAEVCGFDKHLIDPRPLLSGKGLI
jgi:heterodisulfide reductase subunit B2